MRNFIIVGALLALSVGAPLRAQDAEAAPAPKTRNFKLVMSDGLRFSPARVAAEAGERLTFKIDNVDSTDLAHNFVVIKPGTRSAIVALSLAQGADGPARDFVPVSADILGSSKLLPAGNSAVVTVQLPDVKGVYPYVCTFPGHGMMMFGAIYAGVPMPALEADTNLPPTVVAALATGGGKRPFVQRIFMPDAGPAAIAVALRGRQNFCWDAGECRLRYAWQGAFVDGNDHWLSNGLKRAVVPAAPWWRAAPGGFPWRLDRAEAAAPAVKFRGYAMDADGPEFHYTINGVDIFEKITPRTDAPGLAVRLRVRAASGPVFYRAPGEPGGTWRSTAGRWDGDTLVLTPAEATEFTLTLTTPLCGS